ncbi:MAG: exodeoxyribonuclease V alpha subunit [Candidatus Azotimanducaceae bacterium]|jgi:exodeoxyribonuclease V alpha subunit
MIHGPGFEKDFLSFLARKTARFEPASYRILSTLVSSAINQHSCILLDREAQSDIKVLASHPAVGQPGEKTPIVLDGNRLYLARFYQFEEMVASAISQKNREIDTPDADWLRTQLDAGFGIEAGNQQKLAALIALTRSLTIITGGPGTGKTSTVVNLLHILLEQNPEVIIRLAAPTGKAAMRLGEGLSGLNHPAAADIPEVRTLHRLLGVRGDGRTFRHGPDNPFSADVLIVDEASMIDLPMMHRLLNAMPKETRLILLGDPHQLPSVDTGNVLADLCPEDIGYSREFARFARPIIGAIPTSGTINKLSDAICRLDRNYRFASDSGVAALAENIRAGSPEIPAHFLDGSVHVSNPYSEELMLVEYWETYLAQMQDDPSDAAALLSAFDECRILCSRRAGPGGVESLNDQIEHQLEKRGLKTKGEKFYPGRPILVTANDYGLSLFNGDIGICLPIDPWEVEPSASEEPAADTAKEPSATNEFLSSQQLQYLVHFPGQVPRTFLASRLPDHETCFAMTVHKSQGSEFSHVVLIMSEEHHEQSNNLMTRELLYTAVTRARKRVTLHTSDASWSEAIGRSAARVSGMTSFLDIKTLDKGLSEQKSLF